MGMVVCYHRSKESTDPDLILPGSQHSHCEQGLYDASDSSYEFFSQQGSR